WLLCSLSTLISLRRGGRIGQSVRISRGGTGRATAPVDNLGLVDRVAVVVRPGQAGGIADGAVDVGDVPARPAHEEVLVVVDPRLVPGHGARRLDAPHQTRGGQYPQHVVDPLPGHLTEVPAHHAYDRVRVSVGVL